MNDVKIRNFDAHWKWYVQALLVLQLRLEIFFVKTKYYDSNEGKKLLRIYMCAKHTSSSLL